MESWKSPFFNSEKNTYNWQDLKSAHSWIADMSGVIQDPVHHAEGDVETHVKMVIDALLSLPEFIELSDEDKNILFTATLLHDVEKRSTTEVEFIDGRDQVTARNHARKGEKTARLILYRDYPSPFSIREHICKLVRLHGAPLWAIEKENPQKAVVEASLYVNTKLLYLLAKADAIGRICPDKDSLLERLEFFKMLCEENNCWGETRKFPSELSRFYYLNKQEASVDYEPFDDLGSVVYVLSGVPGSGKDTYIKKNLPNIPVISLDDIRRDTTIDKKVRSTTGSVVQIAKDRARVFLRKKESFVWNATNITKDMRSRMNSLFHEYNAKVCIVYIESEYKALLKQNSNREYKVPEHIIEELIEKIEMPDYSEAQLIDFAINY